MCTQARRGGGRLTKAGGPRSFAISLAAGLGAGLLLALAAGASGPLGASPADSTGPVAAELEASGPPLEASGAGVGEATLTAPEALLAPDHVVPEASAEPAPLPARLAAVPFRTQRDGSRFAGSNCGPAALAMVLETWGISLPNDDLRYYTHTYQGTWGSRGGTALQHMARVAEDFGIRTHGLYDGDRFHRWTIAEVREQVAQGHPVIALVKYRLLPEREYSPVRYDHYIVLWALADGGFIYNDPIYPDPEEGFARFISEAQLDAAMQPTLEPRQAVAFLGPVG